MIYYTADTHFGHKNIINLCGRPFADADEMDEALISNWNARVRKRDTVYIVGDMFYRCADAAGILKRLNGKKHLIVGNHDGSWLGGLDPLAYFISFEPMLEIRDCNRLITLCHYPLLTWNREKRSFMIHGHIHNNTDLDFWPLLAARENVLNAGTEINAYSPVTFDELMKNNTAFKQRSAILPDRALNGIVQL